MLPEYAELVGTLDALRDRLATALRSQVELARSRLARLRASYGFRAPIELVRRYEQRLDELSSSATLAIRRQVDSRCEQLATAAGRLRALSPIGVLERGYSITRIAETGQVVRRAADLTPGQALDTVLHEGRFGSRVESIQADDDDWGPDHGQEADI